jgi:uncharacterized protein YjbI with pentapeptide repeats
MTYSRDTGRSGGRNFRYGDLQGVDLSKRDLRNADFTGANMKGTKLDGSDISFATFDGADMTNASFIGAYGKGLSFASCILKYVNFARAAVADSIFRDVDMSQTTLGFVFSKKYSDLCVFRSCSFDGVDLAGQNLNNFVFDRCSFRDVDLSGCELLNTTFPDSEMVAVEITDAIFRPPRRSTERTFIEEASPDGRIDIKNMGG